VSRLPLNLRVGGTGDERLRHEARPKTVPGYPLHIDSCFLGIPPKHEADTLGGEPVIGKAVSLARPPEC